MKKDHYSTLGISKGASSAEIKKAYKKLAMQWHPDRHQGDKKAEERFKEVNEAYQILGDADKKKQYDTFGTTDFSGMGGGAGGQGFGGFDFADIFGSARGRGQQSGGFEFDLSDLFGSFGQTGGGQSRTGGHVTKDDLDITKSVELPIWDLLTGTKLSLEIGGKSFRVTIPACTKPHTKLKISGKGHTHGRTTGDLYLRIDARMPDRLTPEQETNIRLWREQQ